MDELKQSVQLAVHEQKDPLLIYKFEAYELFKSSIESINKEIISFLFKGNIPVQDSQEIEEAREVRRKANYKTTKDEIENTTQQNSPNQQAHQTQQQQVTETIVRDAPKLNRNDQVTIKNAMSGETKSMKFKKAEPLLKSGQWVIVEA